ncbi:MAG: hypothetical protein LQ351_008069 [Letrouitia transgressa]|nr:MAG: hypothetical protein LQ351_008069 [Letrouitia transgressa]
MSAFHTFPVDDSRWRRGRVHISGTVSTQDEVTLAYIECPPPSLTAEKGSILLIHGFPQTSYQFRHVINPLSEAGFRIVAPDYRGAGESSHPRHGFDKLQMAADLHELLHEHLRVPKPVHVVGHDIGGMIAHAYAASFPADTASVAWGECPLPGTSAYEQFKDAPGAFHFHFHWQPDLPELLVAGKEKLYLKHFYHRLGNNYSAISEVDLDHYATMFAQAGGLRCGFDVYRAFAQDAEDNQRYLKEKGKCRVPMQLLAGKEGQPMLKDAGQGFEMYEQVEQNHVAGSGHWVAEENPEGFVDAVLSFANKHP